MDAVVSFVRAVADLLSINDAPLQVSVAQALQQVMRGYLPQGQRRRDDTAWKYNHEIATKAHVADMVVARLAAELDELMTYDADGDNKINAEEMHNAVVDNDADATNDDEAFNETKAADMVRGGQIVRPPYLLGLLVKLVWELSSHGPNSQQLVVQGTPQLLMRLLSAVEDYREQVVYLSIEALWNMLEHSKHHLAQGDICISLKSLLKKHRAANAAYLLANEAAVVTLTSLLERLLLFGFKKADKMLRNEVIVVAALIAERKSAVPLFVQSGFLSLLLEYGVAAEMELPVDANPRNFATSDPVDLEFKTLAWGVVAAMSVASEDAMARVNESLFVQTLLLYLNPSHHHGNRYLQIWAPTQRRSLDLLAGRLLSQIAPQCVSLINSYHGAMVALNHIRSHSSMLSTPPVDDDDGEAATELGEDASVDAPPVDDTEDDVDRQYAALCLLQVTCTEDQQTVLGENGAIEDLLTLLSGINATVPPPAEVAPTATVTAATATPSDLSAGLLVEAVFTALSMLCRGGHEDNQTRFRRAGGVSALLAWLRYDPEDAVVKPLAVVPVVAALWEAVVGNRRSEARFIADEGTIALLDLLDVCPSLARGQVVGVLADLLLNPRSHAYVKSWRSDSSGDDAVVVLLALWGSEERRLGITRAPDGSLADPMRPLDVAVPTAVPGGAGDGGLGGTGSGSGSGEGTPRSPNGSPKGDKPAFDRLRRALKASKLWTRVGGEEPTAKLQRSLGAADLRPKIYAVLASLGMEYDDKAYEKLSWQVRVPACVSLLQAGTSHTCVCVLCGHAFHSTSSHSAWLGGTFRSGRGTCGWTSATTWRRSASTTSVPTCCRWSVSWMRCTTRHLPHNMNNTST